MPRTVHVPAELQAIIDTHRGLFGGFIMMAAPPEDPPEDPPPSDDPPTDPPGDGDKPLGPGGERALQAVRDENKALRGELNAFKQSLAQALGIDPGDKKDDALTTIRSEVATLRRENQVQRVARTHGITDEADIALLMEADENLVTKLAERFKRSADDSAGGGATLPARTPRPDPATGKGNGGRRPSSVQQVMDDVRARRKNTQ